MQPECADHADAEAIVQARGLVFPLSVVTEIQGRPQTSVVNTVGEITALVKSAKAAVLPTGPAGASIEALLAHHANVKAKVSTTDGDVFYPIRSTARPPGRMHLPDMLMSQPAASVGCDLEDFQRVFGPQN